MGELVDFLSLPDVSDIVEEVYVSERLGKFKVKALTQEQHQEFMNRSKGKLKKNGVEFDSNKFQLLIVANQVIEPNFNNAELLQKAKCATATDLIKKKILPGEIAIIADKVLEISGFDNDLVDVIEEAKN